MSDITSDEIVEFCRELKLAIEDTDFTGKVDREIFGQIYTKTRSRIWYRMSEDSALRSMFAKNLKYLSKNLSPKIKNIVDYVINSALEELIPEGELDNVQLTIASMTQVVAEMEVINRISETETNHAVNFFKSNKTLKLNGETNV